MKHIEIRNEPCCDFASETNVTGFEIIFDDEEEEATIFDAGKDKCSKLFSKPKALDFWNMLMEINFQKVLCENEEFQGCDGSWSIVELTVGLHALTMRLWEPSIDNYRDNSKEESLKLLRIVNKIISYVNSQSIDEDYKF